MPGLHATLGGVFGPEVQGERGGQIRDGCDEALLEDVELGSVEAFEAGDDGRQEETQGVETVNEAEVDQGKHPYPAVAEDGADADVLVAGRGFLLFLFKGASEPGLFLGRQPLGFGGGSRRGRTRR